ncbi:MAG: hypothetical protein NT130_03870 [Candidatus Micrarchaeota archaeon]|nr:hypothetical protein [Candidatus Micrarchaeota archaeon]
MQKSGVIKTGPSSEKTDSEGTQGMKGDVEGMQRKKAISEIFRRKRANKQPPAELPKKERIEECIENLFRHSERAQPSKNVNIGASVADSTALVLSAITGNPLIGLIVIPASETIALAKNWYDTNTASKLRKNDLSRLESMKENIISRLKDNKSESDEIEKLVDETKKLFSDIEHKSKEGLATVLGSRLEGFAGSASALALGLTVLKPVSDWVSGMIDSFVLTQPIQPQPYPAPLISYATNLIVKGVAYAVASYSISHIYNTAYNEVRRNSFTWKRELGLEKDQLKERAGKLLEKIAKIEH